jgi:prepilin-type N-terminal cleavage/methylation domain-containing protein
VKAKPSFTLLEVLLSVAIVGVLTAISIPVSRNLLIKNDVDVAAVNVVQTLRRAQILSQASDGDTTWGVRIQVGSITLFKGESYAVRDADFDEIFDLPNSITPSGLPEIVFAKLTGYPQITGTLTLTTSIGDVRSISINAKGTIEY